MVGLTAKGLKRLGRTGRRSPLAFLSNQGTGGPQSIRLRMERICTWSLAFVIALLLGWQTCYSDAFFLPCFVSSFFFAGRAPLASNFPVLHFFVPHVPESYTSLGILATGDFLGWSKYNSR